MISTIEQARQQPTDRDVWMPDRGDGTYKNPVLHADYSDPDLVRVGADFYLVASSFNCVPGLPVLHSPDLVNWRIIGHVLPQIPYGSFDAPKHGGGVWAPSIRYHEGYYWVYYGDPDHGIFMARTRHPAGPWEPLVCVAEARGWIDPCPLWDEDGRAYLVHAWAKSRSGINGVLTVHGMSPDGARLLDEGAMAFDGQDRHPVIEGPKFYKRNGWYYIFAPAGGVGAGWQTVLRARSVFGPYEDKIVLAQGSSDVNGPHQGGWVETGVGESWFMHFQDRGAYGRIVHLQPMRWVGDWPVIGARGDAEGVGEPVREHAKPSVKPVLTPFAPQCGDEFTAPEAGLQWQWQANAQASWWSLTARPDYLRLYASALPKGSVNLWSAGHLLLQKLPAPRFFVTCKLDFSALADGERAGLIIMGLDYAYLAVARYGGMVQLVLAMCRDADLKSSEQVVAQHVLQGQEVTLCMEVVPEAFCRFSHSADGEVYAALGEGFQARPGRWIGAKMGLFCLASDAAPGQGHGDFDWFRVQL